MDVNVTDYVGLPLEDARARAVSAGLSVRVIRPSTAITMDYRTSRLNLLIADDADEVSAVVLEARIG
jgi:hypothetical protein